MATCSSRCAGIGYHVWIPLRPCRIPPCGCFGSHSGPAASRPTDAGHRASIRLSHAESFKQSSSKRSGASGDRGSEGQRPADNSAAALRGSNSNEPSFNRGKSPLGDRASGGGGCGMMSGGDRSTGGPAHGQRHPAALSALNHALGQVTPWRAKLDPTPPHILGVPHSTPPYPISLARQARPTPPHILGAPRSTPPHVASSSPSPTLTCMRRRSD